MAGPTLLNLPTDLAQSKIYTGSLFTMLEVTDPPNAEEEDGEMQEGQQESSASAAAAELV